MSEPTPHARAKRATRLAFLVAGFGLACWAPLVPDAKARVAVDDATLGLLLLCLGAGSVMAMPLTGLVSARLGSRPIILAGAIGTALFLPLLAIAPGPASLGCALFVFGASLGGLDVAMNIHALEVEKPSAKPLMSGFHALFSIGGFAGAFFITGLLSLGLSAQQATMIASVLIALAVAGAWSDFIRGRHGADDEPLFALPRGRVALLALLALIGFLVEGAILDWSGLLLVGQGVLSAEHSGLGYAVFAMAMTLGRLTGDALTARLGDQAMLRWGGVVVVAGFAVLLGASSTWLALASLLLIGLGAANIVPVLFRRAGLQSVMPAGLAVTAISTAGYAGALLGPAGIGFIAHFSSLYAAFWVLTALFCVVPLCAHLAGRASESRRRSV